MKNINELRKYSYQLYLVFLKNYIKSENLIPSFEEENSVKAFCVLIHAALEEYFENLTLKTFQNAKSRLETRIFIKTIPSNSQELSDINERIFQLIKSLVLSTSYTVFSKKSSQTLNEHKTSLEEAEKIFAKKSVFSSTEVEFLTKKSESYLKDLLEESNTFFSKWIFKNHGVSMHYILKLLIPIGIDIPYSLSINSLQFIAKHRGSFAHKTTNVTQVISPRDIAKYLIDTIKLCGVIENSISKFNEYAET